MTGGRKTSPNPSECPASVTHYSLHDCSGNPLLPVALVLGCDEVRIDANLGADDFDDVGDFHGLYCLERFPDYLITGKLLNGRPPFSRHRRNRTDVPAPRVIPCFDAKVPSCRFSTFLAFESELPISPLT